MTASPSFSLPPKVDKPDQHITQTNNDVAYVADVAADMLKEIVLQELDLIGNPDTPADIKARATQRVVAMVSVVKSASQAVTHMAEAETAHAQVLSATTEDFRESAPGAQDSAQDRLSQFLNLKFDKVTGHLLEATGKMGQDPALADVLARRKEPGGVAGFFRRVSSAAVALGALGSRALALPGLVRKAISNGLDRADDAVQNALDSWHAKSGRGVDALRQKAVGLVNTTIEKAHSVADATDRVLDATARFADDKIVQPTFNAAGAVSHAAEVAGTTFMAVNKVVARRLTKGISRFMRETVAPALAGFVDDVRQEVADANAPRQRTMFNVNSFQDQGPAQDAAINTTPKGP